MANSDKNILITPSVGLSTNPTIKFNGANNTPTTLRVLDDGTISFEGTAGQLFSISDGLTGSIFSVNDISGIPSIEVLDTGLVKINQYGGSTVFGASAAIQSSSVNAKVSISTSSATTPGLIIKAAANQSANLQEWQNSNGTWISMIGSDGIFRGTTSNIVNAGTITTQPYSTTQVSLIAKAYTGQTANLQEWQNSSGTVLSSITKDGTLDLRNTSASSLTNSNSGTTGPKIDLWGGQYGIGLEGGRTTAFFPSSGGFSFRKDSSSGTSIVDIPYSGLIGFNKIAQTSAQVWINNSTAANIGLIVQGAASQTANLQEWQDSGGNILSRVGADGRFYSTQIDVAHVNASSQIRGTYEVYAGAAGPLGALSAKSWVSNIITIVARGAASQTADLQQWQSSAGTVLASIDPNGQLRTPQILNTASFNNSRLQMTNTGALLDVGVASNVVLRVRGATSQTADLQQWQNSSGTVLAKIDKDGNFTANNVRGSGAFNYVQTLGTKQTNISGASAALVSATITTVGYPVQIFVTGDAENASAGGWARLQLYRDSTAIGNKVHVEGSAGSENIPFALQFIDTPSAGTYTYSIKTVDTAGGTFNFGETDGPTITVIELGK
jgi:hypothetical protein